MVGIVFLIVRAIIRKKKTPKIAHAPRNTKVITWGIIYYVSGATAMTLFIVFIVLINVWAYTKPNSWDGASIWWGIFISFLLLDIICIIAAFPYKRNKLGKDSPEYKEWKEKIKGVIKDSVRRKGDTTFIT